MPDSSSAPSTPPPGVSFLDHFMAEARAKYFCHPELTEKILASCKMPSPSSIPTPEQMAYNERLDSAIAKSESLLSQARAQLAAPVSDFLPSELTSAELAEKEDAERWMAGYCLADKLTDDMLAKNQQLYEEVMDFIDECEAEGVLIPEDVEVPPAPPTPPLAELEIPREVRGWIEKSRQAWTEYQDGVTDKQQPAVRSMSEQIDKIAADIKAARIEDGKMLKRCTPAVADRIRFFSDLQPSSGSGKASTAPSLSGRLRDVRSTGDASQRSLVMNRSGVNRGKGSLPWRNIWALEFEIGW